MDPTHEDYYNQEKQILTMRAVAGTGGATGKEGALKGWEIQPEYPVMDTRMARFAAGVTSFCRRQNEARMFKEWLIAGILCPKNTERSQAIMMD